MLPFTFSTRKARWRSLAILLIMLLATLAVIESRQVPVQAKSNYLTAFRNTYPGISGSQLDSCSVCHTTIPNRNAYGADYRSHGHNFAAIENLDSDGDGFSNIVEIQALTMPGDASSHPAGNPTSTPTPTAAPTRQPTPTSAPTQPPTPTSAPTQPPAVTPTSPPPPTATPSTPATAGEYEIIGWNDLGMHCTNESFANLAILPPYNTLWAQVIRKGTQPQIVTDNVVIEYSFQNNTTSVGKTDFWTYVKQLFGVQLPPDVGLTGAGLAGQMHSADDHFVIEGVPLTPYEDGKPHVAQPYQLADLVAKDATTGEILATTTFVAPVSTEMHCDDCHSDGMREGIATGNTETNILALHDKEEHTDLMNQRPVLCANCHGSNALGMAGDPGLPNLSQAIHGKHAKGGDEGDKGDDDDDDDDDVAGALSTLSSNDAEPTCYQCHPGPETACLRGTMSAAGLGCESCHGSLQDVAAKNRRPWIDLPRCGDCHGAEYAENPGKLFRQSTGHGGLYCEACHGSTHAILPSTEPRDNIQPIRLQGNPGPISDCRVCHGEGVPDGPGPHGLMAEQPSPTATPSPTPAATPQPGQRRAWLDPQSQSVTVGTGFVVDLRSDQVAVGGFELTLRYDPAVLRLDSASLGDWLDGTGRTVTPLGPQIDNQAGVVRLGAFSYGGSQPPAAESWLARLQFTALAAGNSDLLPELTLTDGNGAVQAVQIDSAGVSVGVLTGDINGDCRVDVNDIMQVAAAWGLRAGDPGWNPALDLVRDDVIDIADIMQVAGHWGDSCAAGTAQRSATAQITHPTGATAVLSLSPEASQWSLDGQSHELRLQIENAQALGGFEFTLNFDPQVLRVLGVELSDWPGANGRTVALLGPEIDNENGRLHLGAFSYGAAAGVSGSGPLAILRVQAVGIGSTSLALSDLQLIDDRGQAQAILGQNAQANIEPMPDVNHLYLPTVFRF